MKVQTKIRLFIAISGILILQTACFKGENFPNEPVISDAKVSTNGDSARVTFSFTDGDADLGLSPADTFGYFHPDSFYYHNIYLDYFEKDDNLGWVPGLDINGDTIRFGYRFKPIEVSDNTEGIKGTIDVDIDDYRNPFSNQSDTVKFSIMLIDRARNKSNIIETPEIISQ